MEKIMNCDCLTTVPNIIRERLSLKDDVSVKCVNTLSVLDGNAKVGESSTKTRLFVPFSVKAPKHDNIKMVVEYCPFCGVSVYDKAGE